MYRRAFHGILEELMILLLIRHHPCSLTKPHIVVYILLPNVIGLEVTIGHKNTLVNISVSL